MPRTGLALLSATLPAQGTAPRSIDVVRAGLSQQPAQPVMGPDRLGLHQHNGWGPGGQPLNAARWVYAVGSIACTLTALMDAF